MLFNKLTSPFLSDAIVSINIDFFEQIYLGIFFTNKATA
jgi:hypothetical protein